MATTSTLAPARSSTRSFGNSTWALSPPNLRYALPFPVTSPTSNRAASSLFTARLSASRIIKIAIGTVIGFLSIIAAWWALDLAMWTAVKEWRDDCRDQKSNTTISRECTEILSKELSQPPVWRSFVSSKIAKRFQPEYQAFRAPPLHWDCRNLTCECSWRPFYANDKAGLGAVLRKAPTLMLWEDTSLLEKFNLYRYALSFQRDDQTKEAGLGSANGLIAIDCGCGDMTPDFSNCLDGTTASDHKEKMSHGQAPEESLNNWDFKERRRSSADQLDDFPDIRHGCRAADRDNSPFQTRLRRCLHEAALHGRGPPMRDVKRLKVTIALDECDCRSIVNGEAEYQDYEEEDCYVEVCQSLAEDRREAHSLELRRRRWQTAIFEDARLKAWGMFLEPQPEKEENNIDQKRAEALPLAISAHHSRKTLCSKAPRKGLYERILDDMIERAECSTLCGTPYSCTCDHWEEHWNDHHTARERLQKQGDAGIMYGGMEKYVNYTAWLKDYQRIRAAKHWEKFKVNPIQEPCWWFDSLDTKLHDENWEMRCGGGYQRVYAAYGINEDELEELDWWWWAEMLSGRYGEKVTVSHTGNGSHEGLRVEVNDPATDVWRRGCHCQRPVRRYEIGIGGWNVYEGPSWVFWDIISTWVAVLMLFFYWDWMSDGPARRRRERARRRFRRKEKAD